MIELFGFAESLNAFYELRAKANVVALRSRNTEFQDLV